MGKGDHYMRQWLSSSLLFTTRMLFSAALSLLGLVVVLVIVVRLDAAFFEANGMISNVDVREAFYLQVFEVDSAIVWMMIAGFAAVGVISFMFCKSQFDYFKRLAGSMSLFTQTWDAPPTKLLGRFNPYITYFYDVMYRRINGETEEGIDPILKRATREWPKQPTVALSEQLQFAAISGLLGIFFSVCCLIFYLKVSGRVVELANTLVRFSSASGPSFLTEQFGIVNILVCLILGMTTLNFIITGYRFGRQIAEADYAILRDMKDFMDGNFRQRFFLRTGDPAREFVLPMNDSLDKICEKLKVPGVVAKASAQKDEAAMAAATDPATKTS